MPRLAELAGVLSDYITLCKEQFAIALLASAGKGNLRFDRRQCANHERQAAGRGGRGATDKKKGGWHYANRPDPLL